MISYWKTQWFNLLMGALDLGFSIYHFCIGDQLWGIGWCLAGVVWLMQAGVNYNDERIKLLEKKQERDDAMYELVQELLEANKIDRELDRAQDEKIKKLEDTLR